MSSHRLSYWKTVFLPGAVLAADVGVVFLWLVRGSIVLPVDVWTPWQNPGWFLAAIICSGFVALFCCLIILGGLFALVGDAREAK